MTVAAGPTPGAVRPGASVRSGTEPLPVRVFGVGLADLHDLAWASQCVQVARPGHTDLVWPSGPALYLLLGRNDLADFDLSPAVRRLHWAGSKLLRIGLTSQERAYTERVVVEHGTPRFERDYRRRGGRSQRVWITPSADLAARWAAAPDYRAAVRAVRAAVARDEVGSLRTPGFVGDAREAASRRGWAGVALPKWSRPNAVLPGVYEYQQGVWAHESARIDPSARVIGSAWIGAGAAVPPGSVVVGPVVLPDAPGASPAPPAPVRWEEVRSSRWSLPSLAKAGQGRLLAKRAFDVAFSLAALACTLPLYPFIMLAIFIEDGRPFFFAHTRQTLGGRNFPCVKFRTMVKNADEIKARLVAANVCDGPQFFMENDPRVLRVGRVLRKFQLDELPQFLNVLAGHMSVVGPRPSPDKENQFCPAWREARLSVRPGVTGLWQVRRTREPLTDFQEWIRYDLEYVQHQSLLTDVRIIIETIARIVGR